MLYSCAPVHIPFDLFIEGVEIIPYSFLRMQTVSGEIIQRGIRKKYIKGGNYESER